MDKFAFAHPSDLSGSATATSQRPVALWLLVCCAMIFAMAVIGAITRLTESGLSIMEWAPITGTLPPLSQGEWERIFALYREIPEYQEMNLGMSLAEFKTIFWWEYIHRLWGRLIGLVFAVPFLWFWLRGRLAPGLTPRLFFLLALGGLQGLLGWYMVASGFADRVDVSQYRLTAHLLLALVIYAYCFWLASGLILAEREETAPSTDQKLKLYLYVLLCLLFLTLASGGLVAGLNAGLIYNTFPLMDGDLFPEGYWQLTPWWLNLFENITAVQFDHRALAVTTAVGTVALWIWSRRLALSRRQHQAMALLAGVVVLQVALGIATLLLVVPIWLGALHQAGAIALLTALLWALQCLRIKTT